MKTAIISIGRAACLAALALWAGALHAQAPSGEQRKPPPQALEACKALKAGQDCSFTAPRGEVKGSCFAPEGKALACKPKNAPTGGQPAPKQ